LRRLPLRVLARSRWRRRYHHDASRPPSTAPTSAAVALRQPQQRGQVGRIHPAGAVGLAETDIAGAQDGAAGTPVMDVQLRAGRLAQVAKGQVVPCGVISSR
jgi:hypothetical protein